MGNPQGHNLETKYRNYASNFKVTEPPTILTGRNTEKTTEGIKTAIQKELFKNHTQRVLCLFVLKIPSSERNSSGQIGRELHNNPILCSKYDVLRKIRMISSYDSSVEELIYKNNLGKMIFK